MEYEILYCHYGEYIVKKVYLNNEGEAKNHIPKGCKIIDMRVFSEDDY